MAFLSVLESMSFFEAFLSFFWSELLGFLLGVYVHCIWVHGGNIPGRGGGMECDGGSGRMLFCDRGCEALLAEELVDFLIPSFGPSWNYFHAIDSVREPDQNPCSEVVDDGSSVGSGIKLHFNDFEFEFPYVLWEVVIIVDTSIGKPGGGLSSRVGALEGDLEVFDEVLEGSEGGSIQCMLGTDSYPAFCSSFSHKGDGISDLFIICGIDIFVDQEVSPD